MFWEGVDIPGDRLSAVVIAKLPFPVPNEPVVAARSETYTDPFNEFSVPEAILLFRQGFGRLIRTASDRGVVAILDSRILTARYGKAFIAALPDIKVVRGPLAELGKAATDWLPGLQKP
jgi:DNA polymerase-3 subunit epsilon/ATP-dependent DNA helicase DinG